MALMPKYPNRRRERAIRNGAQPSASNVTSGIVVGDRVAKFVSEKVGISFFPPFTGIGIERHGEIICAVVFNCFEEAAVHASVAGHGWTREFLKCVGQYVYEQLGYERITVQTEHTEVVRLAERLGGQVEGCLRNHFGKGRDAYIVGILKQEYRFRNIGGSHRLDAKTA